MSFELAPQNYNANWPALFEIEKLSLLNAASAFVTEIYHIGSTSIAGLSAKPVIDILIETKSSHLSSLTKPFENLGYNYKGEYGISGRAYFSRPKSSDKMPIHIHCFEEGHQEIVKHLAFRDYLRAHPDIRQQYQSLKDSILSDINISRDDYQNLKQDFLNEENRKAQIWNSKNSNRPRPIKKVVMYVVRNISGTPEILVFDHLKYPEVSPQVPSGTVEPGEDIYSAAKRELTEETGLNLTTAFTFLGSYVFYKKHIDQFQERHIFMANANGLPENWIHKVTGSGDDKNLEFKYHWISLNEAILKLTANLGDGLVFFADVIKNSFS